MTQIKLETRIVNDEYTEFIYNSFDIQNKELTQTIVNFDLKEGKNFDWSIGAVIGASGSGKSTILKRLGEIRVPEFNYDKALISNFDWITPDEAARVLTSIGLSSVPTWLRPYSALSNGEQYRAQLAYLVASAKDDEVILVDEYTSVVDRDVAKAMSFALSKYIRREKKRIILASCHYDILEWLNPDWICIPEKGGMLERFVYNDDKDYQIHSAVEKDTILKVSANEVTI
jgi:ABC-type lipoprotein export system ATPase subunit